MILPLGLPVVAGFLLVYAAIASPAAWLIRLLSFFPPFTPILMPARIALGHVDVWEIVLAGLPSASHNISDARIGVLQHFSRWFADAA